jgi:hypothetical protein
MLGLGRASEYAGWWNQGLKSLAFTSTSTLTPTIRRVGGFSWAARDSNSGTFGTNGLGYGSIAAGSINLSGLTGYTGYNTYRSTNVVSFYPNSSTWTGYGNAIYLNVGQQFTNASGGSTNITLQVNINGTTMTIQGYSGQTLTLPNTVSTYYDQWMTMVQSTAETSTVFTSWAGGTGSGIATRIAAYNTLTGALIAKSDAWQPSNIWLGNWATDYGTTLTVGQGVGGNNNYYNQTGGAGSDSDTNNPLTPVGGYFYAWGTMFDPLSSTDTSWRTAAPNSQIGEAIPFIQSQYAGGYTPPGTPGPYQSYFNVNPSGLSLYSQPANYVWQSNPSLTSNANQMYSNTILIGNN